MTEQTKPNREVALTLLRQGHTIMYRKLLPDHEELFDMIDDHAEKVEALEDEIERLRERLEW